ncbi:uncharacterized protein LOC133907158 [Phragmites australis]|uniref:uncharacterized protein LOC133907158 n=1 Tax=Phragmites australis TaxID=29695 RepID=UPI002D777371|nr:uncharacterized protein LOC133907158 [Phragmites australis]
MTKVHPQPDVEPEIKNKLRHLPQVFSRVLELPFPMDTNVRTYFSPDANYFIVTPDAAGEPDEVKVRVVTIEPLGITKVVVHIGPGEPDPEDDMVYDKWRFHLSKTFILSMIVAKYVDRHLIVIVPNEVASDDDKGIPLCINERTGGGGERKHEICDGASSVPSI